MTTNELAEHLHQVAWQALKEEYDAWEHIGPKDISKVVELVCGGLALWLFNEIHNATTIGEVTRIAADLLETFNA